MSAEPFDRVALMDRIDDDRELLAELFEDFLEDQAEHMGRAREGLEAGDAKVLYDGAHGIRGCVANFCAQNALETATRLQEMASQGMGNGVANTFRELEGTMAALEAGLRAFIEENKA